MTTRILRTLTSLIVGMSDHDDPQDHEELEGDNGGRCLTMRGVARYRNLTAPLIDHYQHKGVLETFKGTQSDVIYPQVGATPVYCEDILRNSGVGSAVSSLRRSRGSGLADVDDVVVSLRVDVVVIND
jgi:hypothetical protein